MAKVTLYFTLVVVLVSFAYAKEDEECPEPVRNPDPAYNEGDDCYVSNPLCYGYYAPHPIYCYRFLQCTHARFIGRNCSPGLHWNQEEGACDWPANVGCEGLTTERSTTVAPTTTPQTTTVTGFPETTTTEYPETTTEDYTTTEYETTYTDNYEQVQYRR